MSRKLRSPGGKGLSADGMWLAAALAALGSAPAVLAALPCDLAEQGVAKERSHPEMRRYESWAELGRRPTKDWSQFNPETRFDVRRDGQGKVNGGRIRVLVDNPKAEIYVLSEANGWGRDLKPEDRLKAVDGTPYYEGEVRGLRHGMEYRLQVNGQQVIDPAAAYYTTPGYLEGTGRPGEKFLNSVFWDFAGPEHYKMRNPTVDLRGKPVIIGETEVMALVRNFEWNGQKGPKNERDTYRFVVESGVIGELKKAGYNAIEFLPFNASVDGGSWHFRYQVFGLFAPEGRYGTPSEFARMIDAFNGEGVAVIMDAVVGHYPKSGNEDVRSLDAAGIHRWLKPDGQPLFGSVASPWGTNRYDYANPYVRKFLIDSILHMLKQYRISGIRFDNLDGIRLYEGPGGGGPEFLRELAREIRAYQPGTLLIGEMFFGHRPVTESLDRGGFGIDARTHSDFFDFYKDFLRKNTEEIDLNRLRDAIRNPWEWGEIARVTYMTNHDEAANRRDGATGAYPATLLNGGGWEYVERKTRAFGALAMLASPGIYLDMPQLRLLQEGTFSSNPHIDWSLTRHDSQKGVYQFFSDLSRLVGSREAFALHANDGAMENHVDHGNKVISVMRRDPTTGKKLYAIINLGHKSLPNYRVGVHDQGKYELILDGDHAAYRGSGELGRALNGSSTLTADGQGEHGKPAGVTLPVLPPYGVVVIEQ